MADGDFRLAGAYVEVNLKDDTEADEARIRRRLEAGGPVDFETALKDPANIRRVKERIEAGAPIKLVTDADITRAKATIAELEASKKSTVVNVDANIKAAQAHLADLQARPIKVDADIAAAKARIQALLDSRDSKTLKIDADIETAKAKIATLLGQRSTAVTPDFFNGLTKQIQAAELLIQRMENEKRELTVDVIAQTNAAVVEIARLKALRPTVEAEIDPKVEKVNASIAALEARKVRITADVDADLARVHAQLAALSAEHVEVDVDVELDKPAERKFQDDVESAVDRVANRANAKMEAIKFAVLFAGLPAAAAVGAAGVGVALSAIPLLFAGIGLAALGANDDIADAMSSTARHVSTEMTAMAQPMVGTFVEATSMVGASFDRLEPQISKAMLGSQKPFLTFVSGVTDFAENAMPGFNAAIESSQGPMEGMKSLLAQTGSGLDDMFKNLATGSAGAKTGLEDFGGIVRDAEGFLGQFLANLANGSHGVLPQFGGAMNQVYGVLNTLTSSGMPALTGVTSGFLGTVGGGLGIVQGFSSALGSWAQPLGNLGGSLFATNAIAKIFGTSLGETGFGLGAFAGKLDEAGNRTTPFKMALADADKAGTSKLKAGISALATGGFNPLGIALVGGGLLLDAWGKKTQEAAQDAAAFKKSVGELRNTLSISTGAVTQATRETAANNLVTKELGDTHKKASDFAKEYGIGMGLSTEAATGNLSALRQVDGQLRGNVDTVLKATLSQDHWNALSKVGITAQDMTTLALGGSAGGYKNLAEAIDKTGGATKGWAAMVGQAFTLTETATGGQRAFWTELTRANAELSEAQRQMRTLGDASSYTGETLKLSAGAAGVLSSALQAIGNDAATAADSGKALLVALDLLGGGTQSLSAAQAKSGEAFAKVDEYLKALAEGGKKAKGSFQDLVNGDGGINGLTSKGAALQGVFTALNSTMAVETSAAFNNAQAANKSLGESLDSVGAVTGRAREKFISAATAAGLTATEAKTLADQMGLIPDLVEIQFASKGDQAVQDKLLDISKKVRSNNDKTIIVKAESIRGAEDELVALGYRLTTLPNGEVRITAKDASKVEAEVTTIADKVNGLPNKTLTIDAPSAAVITQLEQVGYKVTTLPDGKVVVTADTGPASDGTSTLMNGINAQKGSVTVDAVTSPAEAGVINWKNATSSVTGTTTTYTTTDPATGQVQQWKSNADATGARTTTYTSTDPATGQVRVWKQNTDGTWGTVQVYANAGAAEAAINNAARNRSSTITVTTYYNNVGAGPKRIGETGLAKGGLVGYAFGGQIQSVPKFSQGALDIRSGGLLHGPGTGTSDSILAATSQGPALVSNREFVVNAKATSENLGLLKLINSGRVKAFAGGGLLDAAQEMLNQVSSGGQFFEDFSFYGNSANVSKYNDQIQALFGQSRGVGWDFDPNNERTRTDITSWLSNYVRQQTAQTSAATTSSTGGGGGTTINNNYYTTINPPAGMDVYTLASQVSRELELRSKAGV